MVRIGFRPLSAAAFVVGLGLGCSKAPKPEPSKADRSGIEAPTKASEDATKVAGETKVAVPPSDLGERFKDPAWFRKDAFPDAKVIKFGRTEASAEGLFASQILFEFEGADVDACAEKVRGHVEPHVPGLQPDKGADGRITLKGHTDRYEVTLVCGAVEGKTKAYVGYRWLN